MGVFFGCDTQSLKWAFIRDADFLLAKFKFSLSSLILPAERVAHHGWASQVTHHASSPYEGTVLLPLILTDIIVFCLFV